MFCPLIVYEIVYIMSIRRSTLLPSTLREVGKLKEYITKISTYTLFLSHKVESDMGLMLPEISRDSCLVEQEDCALLGGTMCVVGRNYVRVETMLSPELVLKDSHLQK